MADFMSALKNSTDRVQNNISVTENGAIGKKTTGKALLDLNFLLSSMRNMAPDHIWDLFLLAYNENPSLALKWLFFARDARGGCGERRTFRVIFERFCRENPDLAVRLIHLIPFYGRWDDVVEVIFADVPCLVRDEAIRMLTKQINADVQVCFDVLLDKQADCSVSLLAKWMPSLQTSSDETRRRAEFLRNALGWTPKQYRTNLVALRRHIHVVEQKMSANRWDKINYEHVPSRASMNYRSAFLRHDEDRYSDYLNNVKSGKAKIHAGVLFPHDIVHAYRFAGKSMDTTLEEQWKALPNTVPDNSSTLVVVDGSGSMMSTVGDTNISGLDISYALGIYFAEKLKGPYYNSFITFSSRPQFVHFADGLTLSAKLQIMRNYDDCSNTNIEKTFDLILDTAVKNHLSQEDLPANVLIVSDMEFDSLTHETFWSESPTVDQALFDAIAGRFEAQGYKLPRLVFWNVCSRTGTIPLSENDLGVALVSGFSPMIADMVMSSELDPYQCLLDKLNSDRYKQVEMALKE